MTNETFMQILRTFEFDKRNKFKVLKLASDVDLIIFKNIEIINIQIGRKATGKKHFYIIKNADGDTVAGVYDMSSDLHWVVLPEFRREGLIIKPLKSIIIPHLLEYRESITVTIDTEIGPGNLIASGKIAVSVGFSKVKEEHGVSEYILHR